MAVEATQAVHSASRAATGSRMPERSRLNRIRNSRIRDGSRRGGQVLEDDTIMERVEHRRGPVRRGSTKAHPWRRLCRHGGAQSVPKG